MSKIKVAIFLVGLSGGAGKVVMNYFSHMPDDYQVDIITMHIESEELLKQYQKLNFNVVKVPSKKESLLKNMTSMYSILKNGHYDVAYAHMTLTNFFPLFIAKLCNIKLRISHSHLAPKKKTLLEKGLAILTNKVLTDRLACGKEAGKFLYGNRKFIIINNAVDLNKFRFNEKKRVEIRKRLNIPQDSFVVGHVGRFDRQKNHTMIIKIFKTLINKYNHSYLMLIGDGNLKSSIEELVNENSLHNNVRFVGEVNDVFNYLNALDVFILPSLFEGLSVSAIEAQANGVPCIFANTVSKETALTKNTYFESLTNIDGWVKKILNVNRDSSDIVEKQIISNGYGIEHEANRFDAWLKKRVKETSGTN